MSTVLISALLLAVSFMVQAGCYAQKEPPVAKPYNQNLKTFDESFQEHDLGDVEAGTVVKHSFTIKNTTKKNLWIDNVNSSCGCTASEVKKKMLEPEESTSLDVAFNSKGYSGSVKQFVYVHTSDSENPILKFTIKANVIPAPRQSK